MLGNDGTAAIDEVEMSGTVPTNWKVEFNPKTIPSVAPNEKKEVQVLVTPGDKAIAGDYVASFRANGRGESCVGRLPHHGHDLDPLGHRRHRHHRHRAARPARRGRALRPAMSDNVIEARGLLKLYGATRAVDAIDLDIRRGEIFGLLGPNGAGKTTTILMMLGLTETSGGTVEVLGFDPVRQPLEVKRRVDQRSKQYGQLVPCAWGLSPRGTARSGGRRRTDRRRSACCRRRSRGAGS